ncbi:hypothetical protein ACHAWF_014694, partial [Thalassiosira exigua]
MEAADEKTPQPSDGTNSVETTGKMPGPAKRMPRIIRRKKKSSSADANDLPAHIRNNTQLHHIINTTLPKDYEFEIPKTLWRIEKANATAIALQLPEGLLMYASTIGDILIKFAYRFQPPTPQDGEGRKKDRPNEIKSLSILGDVTYGACCIDDLSARALGCDLLVHYGHSCLVPLTCTVIPCLYIFVEIRVDVQHLVDCVKLTFLEEENERQTINTREEKEGREDCAPTRIIEALVMGTVQFRSAVVESSQRLNGGDNESTSSSLEKIQFQAIVPQAKPLSPGEVLGCTAPSGLAEMNFEEALSRSRRRQARKGQGEAVDACEKAVNGDAVKERVMIFLADGRFHLEAAMISNPSLRALRYDPYSKTLTEERYEIVKMKKLRREAIISVRHILGISAPVQRVDMVGGMPNPSNHCADDIANSVLQRQSFPTEHQPSSDHCTPKRLLTVGIILGTLGRQGNPAILSRIRSLLHSRGIRSMIILLSEIFPQ